MTAQAPGRPVMADSASSWRDSLIRLRTRVISNPRFQRWAAASPLPRFSARRGTTTKLLLPTGPAWKASKSASLSSFSQFFCGKCLTGSQMAP